MTRILILEATPIDPATGLNVTIKLRTAGSIENDVWDDYEPSIKSDFSSGATFSRDGILSTVSATYSNIDFDLSENLGWSNLSWNGCIAQLYLAETGQAKAEWRPIYFGAMGPLAVDGLTASLPLIGSEAALDRPLLSEIYAGTGGAEGQPEMKGTTKPYLIGSALNVSPVMVDYAQQIYQVHAGAATIDAVYEGALSLGAPVANATDYAALIGATLTDGQWITCTSLGLFRLANEPTFMVTADATAQSDASIGNLAKTILNSAGVGNSKIDTSITSITDEWAYYTTEDVTVGDVLRTMFADAGYYVLTNAAGKFVAGEYYSDDASVIELENSELNDTKIISAKTIAATSPIWRLRYGHSRNFTEMTLDDIAAAVGEDAGVDQAARDAAQDALDAAIAAQSSADLASNRLDAMVNDNVLDRTEKRNIVIQFESYTAEKAGIIAQATSLSVSSTGYNTAYNALQTYLAGLTPAWNNTAVDTPIVAATFKSKFTDYLAARQSILNAISNKAATTAGWTAVTGRPTDLAGLNSAEGAKLSGIEINATKGAPVGTSIGSRPVADFLDDFDGLIAAVDDTVTANAAMLAAETAANNAGSAATTASGHASAAAGSAATATSKSNEANDAASVATAAKVAAETASSTSTTQAGIATTQAANANTSAANAQSSAVLAASVAGGFLNENAGFDAYPSATAGQFPTGWSSMNGAAHYRVSDGAGYAVRIPSTAATAAAIQYIKYDTPAVAAGGWYVLEADIILNSGALDGSGIILRPLNSSGTAVGSDIPFQFNTSPDNTNTVVGAGVAGRAYSFRKLIQIPASATTTHGYRIRLYSHSSALGSIAAANDITFRKVGFRPANQAEIDVGVVLPDLQATVTNQATAIATATSRTAAYLTRVSSGVGTAELSLVALDSGGSAASQISLKADAIKLGSIATPVLSISNGQAYFSGKLNAGTVDAAAINVANLSAISSNLGTIQVTTANIADLSVSTLKIQNQAVTIPVGAYTDAAIAVTNVSTSANPGTVIQSATIASTGAPLKIDFSFAISGDEHVNHRCHIRVRRGTTQILLITDITAGLIEGRRGAISFNFTDNPTAGTHTYYLEVATSIGGSAKNRGLYLLETKR